MTYKKKAVVLSAILFVMCSVYIFSLLFDPGNRRDASFAWLESQFHNMADRIEIYGLHGEVILVRRNNIWFFLNEGQELPVRQGRVEDLFAALGRRQPFTLRATSAEARLRLGLTEDRASRIIVRAGAGLPLLDLLVGTADALGREIYLREATRNQIFSGEDHLTFFTDLRPASWLDLRLFGAATGMDGDAFRGRPDSIDMVQQAELRLPWGELIVLRRSATGWWFPGFNYQVSTMRVDAWLRSVLEAEGEAFAGELPETIEASITLVLGDGQLRLIEAGPLDEEGRRIVRSSGSPFTYFMGEWNFNRLFRYRAHFL